MKVGASPGRSLAARYPMNTNSSTITPAQISSPSGFSDRMERIIPSCAEQGIARASRTVEIASPFTFQGFE